MSPQAAVGIQQRPYGVYPPTNLMNPDGFVITNLGLQYIEAHVANEGAAPLQNVRVYIEGFSDPDIAPTLELRVLPALPAGGITPVRFLVDASAASVAKTSVSFIIEADGYAFRRVIKKIFVTRLRFDKTSKTVEVLAPQGRMDVRFHSMAVGRQCSCKDEKGKGRRLVMLPTHVSYNWTPNPAFSGKHSPLPYEDPWWKVLVFIAAFLVMLAIAAAYDYFSDGTFDGGSLVVGGGDVPADPDAEIFYESNDPTQESCCDDVVSKIPQKNDDVSAGASGNGDYVEKGLYGACQRL